MIKKRTITNILVFIVICAILGSAYYYISKEEPTDEIYTSSEYITVFKCNAADITSMEITNPTSKYTLYKAGDTWQLKNYEGAQLLLYLIENLTYTFSSVTSEELIEENAQDLAQYGLDDPQASIHLTLADGREKTIYIGNATPDHAEYYFNTDDSNDVYVLYNSKVSDIMRSPSDYRDKVIATGEASDIDEVEIIKNGKTQLHIKVREGGARDNLGILSFWNILEPYERNASNEEVYSRITQYVASINASSYADNTENALEEYGLKNPEYIVKVHSTVSGDTTYRVGNKTESARYVLKEGSKYIFLVDEAAIQFVETSVYDILERYIALVEIDNFASVKLNNDGVVTMLSSEKGATEEDDDDLYYLEGQQVETEKFKDFYQMLIGLSVDGEIQNVGQKNISHSIVYTLTTGDTINIEFGEYNDRSYAVYIDGECEFYIRKKKVENMFSSLSKLKANIK